MITRILLIAVGSILSCCAFEDIDANNRPKLSLSLDGEETLSLSCGLTVPRIKFSRGVPLVTVRIMRRNPVEEDLADAYELWKADQFVAAWRDPCTNVVTLLRMAYPFPRGYHSDQRVQAAAYWTETRKWADQGYENISQENIQDWLFTYYREKCTTDQKPVWAGEGVKECNKFTAVVYGQAHLIYVFRMKNEKDIIKGQVPYFVLDITTSQTGFSTANEHFAEAFLRKTFFDPVAYQTEQSFWRTEPMNSYMRANAVRGIINLANEWKDFHYQQFIFLSNNPGTFSYAMAGLTHLENVYALFPSVLPSCTPSRDPAVTVLRLYATAWEFEDCLPPTRKWAGGAYVGSDEIILRGWSNGCNVHESAHQYLDWATGRRGVSTWFNEGFASYFGGCKVADGQLVADPIDSGHILISMVKNNEMDIVEKVFTVRDFYEDEAFLRNPKSLAPALRRAKNYAAAWGIIYFLREAPPLYPDKNYESLIPLYWDTLQRGGNPDSATRAVLRQLTMPTFLDDFRDYFLSFEDLYKEQEEASGKLACTCEFCEMLRRTRQPFPKELSLTGRNNLEPKQAPEMLPQARNVESQAKPRSAPEIKAFQMTNTLLATTSPTQQPAPPLHRNQGFILLAIAALLGAVAIATGVVLYLRARR